VKLLIVFLYLTCLAKLPTELRDLPAKTELHDVNSPNRDRSAR
jgi:hypothetical protein